MEIIRAINYKCDGHLIFDGLDPLRIGYLPFEENCFCIVVEISGIEIVKKEK